MGSVLTISDIEGKMAESRGSLLAKSVQKHAGRAKEKVSSQQVDLKFFPRPDFKFMCIYGMVTLLPDSGHQHTNKDIFRMRVHTFGAFRLKGVRAANAETGPMTQIRSSKNTQNYSPGQFKCCKMINRRLLVSIPRGKVKIHGILETIIYK